LRHMAAPPRSKQTTFVLTAGRAFLFGWTHDLAEARSWHLTALEDGEHICSKLQDEYEASCRHGLGKASMACLMNLSPRVARGGVKMPQSAMDSQARNIVMKAVMRHHGDPWMCNPPAVVPDEWTHAGGTPAGWADKMTRGGILMNRAVLRWFRTGMWSGWSV